MSRKTNSPKNIIISHVYSRENKGDAALTSVLIQDLRRKFKGANLTILQLESIKHNGRFEGVAEKPSFMYYVANRYRNPLLKLTYALYMMSATLFWAAVRRYLGWNIYLPPHLRETAQLYEQADLIVPVGGGYIRSRKGLAMCFNVPLLLHPLLVGYLLGKPTVLYPQSIGPFVHRFEGRLVALVLKRMTLVVLREDASVNLLARLGVTHNVVRSVDSGFLLRSTQRSNVHKTYSIPANKLIVGVTVRAWLTGTAQTVYERAVAEALDNIVEQFGVHILFIPQVTASKGDDDRVVSRRVRKYMRHPTGVTLLNASLDQYQIKSIYNELDALLGTRFHSVIFSLTSFVPVVAIEYEHKTSGIMHDLGLDQWVIKIEDVATAKLIAALHELLQHKTQYKAYLHKHVPPYVQKARQTIVMTAQTYDSLTD
jgi:colanic acid/amylovoran biosynthesis protein